MITSTLLDDISEDADREESQRYTPMCHRQYPRFVCEEYSVYARVLVSINRNANGEARSYFDCHGAVVKGSRSFLCRCYFAVCYRDKSVTFCK